MTTAATDTPLTLRRGDCLGVLSRMEPASVDLVFASPPYERARKYDELNFSLRGLAWAAWCADRFEACLRVSCGLVASLAVLAARGPAHCRAALARRAPAATVLVPAARHPRRGRKPMVLAENRSEIER